MDQPRSLILNRPHAEPSRHWVERDGRLELSEGRRPAAYEVFDTRHNTRRSVALERVNAIRERLAEWRRDDWPGVTRVTRSLLEHWRDPDARDYPFYFAQIEAIESLVWWVEAPAAYRQGIDLPGDGGAWERICSKMATGTGKTLVMGMIVCWQALNALTYPNRRGDFASGIFVVAPGLTVKERLQVLRPGNPANVYDEFHLCPSEALRQKLNRAELVIDNWHTLMPAKDAPRSVVKKGPESDRAFVRRVLGPLAQHRRIAVINDEAHHAYREPPEGRERQQARRVARELGVDAEEATRWIEGLDRIHRKAGILRCFDLTATPFTPTGKTHTEQGLFEWIVSDYGLNDAIEAGLVKTPRVVVRDNVLPDAATMRPKLYHLYREASVHEDLNRKGAKPHEPLPDLVKQAYTLLGADWRAAREAWAAEGHPVPPVMLTVCNATATAARIEHYFNQGDAHWPELQAPERTLRVDSRVLEKAEIGEETGSDKAYEARLHEIVDAVDLPADRREALRSMKKEELLREIVDNVGKPGTAGAGLQNVVSVQMLSEGWDAKNVTHIMGLRAFSSQLLCEQVIGRGLRRVSHDKDDDGYFHPEYVNVFGVPLSILQEVGDGGEAPAPPKTTREIAALPERNSREIRWPNVLRVDEVVRPTLVLDWERVEPLRLDPAETVIEADLAPALGGASDLRQAEAIDLERLPEGFRLQRLTFRAAQKAFDELRDRFRGQREHLIHELVRLVEEFHGSDRLDIPSLYHQDPLRRRILIALNIDRIVAHLVRHVEEQNREYLVPVYDEEMPINSTRNMRTWYTTRPVIPTERSQINCMVGDSAWEQHAANALERHPAVAAYAKNDHLGFQVHYLWNGARRRYVPDFLVRFTDGSMLVLEIKGQESEQDRAKRAAMQQWIEAVNDEGGFGRWAADVVYEPAGIQDVLERHAPAAAEDAPAPS